MTDKTWEEQKKYFEANLLDGDAIQYGQMLSAPEVWVVVAELLSLQQKQFEEAIKKLKPDFSDKDVVPWTKEKAIAFDRGFKQAIRATLRKGKI